MSTLINKNKIATLKKQKEKALEDDVNYLEEVMNVAIKNKEIVECQSRPNLKILDLTGAGDLFAAGFLNGLINNVSTKQCLIQGTEMSSKIIQKVGARLD